VKGREAGWVAVLASGLYGEKVTAAQLLGREEEEIASRTSEAERDLAKLERKMARAGMMSTKGPEKKGKR